MDVVSAQDLLAVCSGLVVGFSLGLVGGGGSIFAVPLLVYVVGVDSAHMAIGTSALAVGLSAATNLYYHAKAKTVRWRRALIFAAFGVAGAATGAAIGKIVDGQKLLTLFGVLMVVVGILQFRRGGGVDRPDVRFTRSSAVKMLPGLMGFGFGTGSLAGFFGIGGGFLIVPGLMRSTTMPIINAIGSSLVCITAFGLTTAASYAVSGLVDWRITAFLLLGAALGGAAGSGLARRLALKKYALAYTFAGVIVCVGVYVAVRGALSLA